MSSLVLLQAISSNNSLHSTTRSAPIYGFLFDRPDVSLSLARLLPLWLPRTFKNKTRSLPALFTITHECLNFTGDLQVAQTILIAVANWNRIRNVDNEILPANWKSLLPPWPNRILDLLLPTAQILRQPVRFYIRGGYSKKTFLYQRFLFQKHLPDSAILLLLICIWTISPFASPRYTDIFIDIDSSRHLFTGLHGLSHVCVRWCGVDQSQKPFDDHEVQLPKSEDESCFLFM